MAVVSKVDAAKRLIVSGINMLERGDDPLAIHLVVSSALNMLRELIVYAGDNYCHRIFKEGLFEAASASGSGEQTRLPPSAAMSALISQVMAGIRAGEIHEASDLAVDLNPQDLRRLLLDYIYRPAPAGRVRANARPAGWVPKSDLLRTHYLWQLSTHCGRAPGPFRPS